MGFWERLSGKGNVAQTKRESHAGSSGDLAFRSDDLLGVIVWIQGSGQTRPDEHAAAMEFFKTANPQAASVLKKKQSAKNIQVGVVKTDIRDDSRFEDSAVQAAMDQGNKLGPHVLVVQRGRIETDTQGTARFVLCSFFEAHEKSLVMPQPNTQIVLE